MTAEETQKIGYRPEIDGLRCLAILIVVLFHLKTNVLPGGYVGVDVFFVISGFLITRIVWVSASRNEFSFIKFYGRRARRILPALFSVLFITYCVGIFVFWPREMELLAQSALAAMLFVSNLFFFSQSGYFGPDSHSLPLLHTWTIGVEEQFYILFPLLLMGIAKFRKAWGPAAICTLLVISFSSTAWAVSRYPTATFYLLPFRSWELLLGASLAIAPTREPGNRIAIVGFIGGLALISFSAITFTSSTPVPGIPALAPCVGAALVIWTGPAVRTSVGMILTNPTAVGLGRISYSLYLWHWPAIVYMSALRLPYERFSVVDILIFFAVLFLISTASYFFIEQPFRRAGARHLVRPSALVGPVAATLTVVFAAGIFTHGFSEFRITEAERQKIYDSAIAYQKGKYNPACLQGQYTAAKNYAWDRCLLAAYSGPSILLWGDSVAAYQSFGIKDMADRAGYRIRMGTKAGCRPGTGTGQPECDAFTKRMMKEALRIKSELIVLSARWNIEDHYTAKSGKSVGKRAVEIASRLRQSGKKIVILGPPVQYSKPLPQLLLQAKLDKLDSFDTSGALMASAATVDTEMAQLAAENDIGYISVIRATCHKQRCRVLAGKKLMAWDIHHLTRAGSEFTAARIFPKLIADIRN